VGSAVATFARAAGLRRRHFAAPRMRVEREYLARFGDRKADCRSRILCYHGVGTPAWGVNDLSSERFAEQLETALSMGYRFVSLEHAVQSAQPKTLAITFDDGLASVARSAAPILRRFGVPFTVFVVTDWLDGRHDFGEEVFMSWDELEGLAAIGASVGSHSLDHPNFAHIAPDEATRQLIASRDAISAHLGLVPTAFAIPFGRSSDWTPAATAAADRAGYSLILAQSEDARPPGTIPRTFVAGSDNRACFRAALAGAFDAWEEWA